MPSKKKKSHPFLLRYRILRLVSNLLFSSTGQTLKRNEREGGKLKLLLVNKYSNLKVEFEIESQKLEIFNTLKVALYSPLRCKTVVVAGKRKRLI